MAYKLYLHGWNVRQFPAHIVVIDWMADYHHPHSALLGLVSAMYSLGAIVIVPFVPSVVDRFGRRHAILIGSILMIFGGILQGAALNREYLMAFGTLEHFSS